MGEDVFQISLAKFGLVKRCSKSPGSGRVGSGQVMRFSDLMGRAGSPCPDPTREKPWLHEISRVGPSRVRRLQNSWVRPGHPAPIRLAR